VSGRLGDDQSAEPAAVTEIASAPAQQ
jgi:hypothetical protein